MLQCIYVIPPISGLSGDAVSGHTLPLLMLKLQAEAISDEAEKMSVSKVTSFGFSSLQFPSMFSCFHVIFIFICMI